MAHRTQLYLDDTQYEYLKDLARAEKKSIAQVIRDWIEERRQKRLLTKFDKDPFWKLRGIGSSGLKDVGRRFNDYLYGRKK